MDKDMKEIKTKKPIQNIKYWKEQTAGYAKDYAKAMQQCADAQKLAAERKQKLQEQGNLIIDLNTQLIKKDIELQEQIQKNKSTVLLLTTISDKYTRCKLAFERLVKDEF